MEFRRDESIRVSSILYFSSKVNRNIFSVFATICSVQLANQWKMAIFIEGDDEVGNPTMVEGRPYPLGGFPKRWIK